MKTRRAMLSVVTAGLCAGALMLSACGGGGGASLAKFCRDNTAVGNRVVSLSDLDSTGPASAADFAAAANATKKLSGEAPSAVTADLKLITNALKDSASHGSAAFDSDTTQAAIGRVSTFVDSACSAPTSNS